MAKHEKIEGTTEAWENRKLGAEEEYARLSKTVSGSDTDEALGLQMISIRLEKNLLEMLKAIATIEGVGYQPLVRDVLNRFALTEGKRLVREYQSEIAETSNCETLDDPEGEPRRCA